LGGCKLWLGLLADLALENETGDENAAAIAVAGITFYPRGYKGQLPALLYQVV
jgi:hypothetical protein